MTTESHYGNGRQSLKEAQAHTETDTECAAFSMKKRYLGHWVTPPDTPGRGLKR